MSYQVLARKWRPHRFEDVVGQSHVLTALTNALTHNRLHHAYLFSGTRGVGKTTIARLFAKGLNCEQGITASPCGQCHTCQEIDQGRFVDLLEIDAASRTKVEDTRELLDNVQYQPARGRFKVYLIDEVHMLSRHSFNALLKTLEEPPEHVKFILATTDPQKLPVTILSRCLQFHLKHLDNVQIQQQLDHVLTAEGISFEAKALSLLARAAEGSMRDALSLTDQAIALGNGQVQSDTVAGMLGTLNTEQALYLLEAMAQGQAEPAMACLAELAAVGVAWDSLLSEMAAQLHRVAMYQVLPASLDASLPDAERIVQLSQLMPPQDVQLHYQIALQGRQDLPLAPDGRTGLEMVMLRMLAFRPVAAGTLMPQPIAVPAAAPESSPSAPQVRQPAQPVPQAVPVQTAPPQMHSATEPQSMQHQAATPTSGVSVLGAAVSTEAPQPEPASESAPEPMPEPAPTPQPSSPASGLLAARNKLRSKAKRGQESTEPKKAEPASVKKPATSVLDRISNQHASRRSQQTGQQTAPVNAMQPSQPKPVEEYQWQPVSQPEVDHQPEVVVAPTALKQALEHEKTPEMAKQLVSEAANQDSWSDMVTKLNVDRLVQQLALNSAMVLEEQQLTLQLRPSQQHLDTPKARAQLSAALAEMLGQEIELQIELSDKGRTPLEWREFLYQQKLDQAKVSLQQDPNVSFICQRFSAVLDEESVRPV
ncbi:DNA polymerase III subunit gamma/tau [Photobacterium galatheae]|uniref:DNA polymerase III subunit gamma/tau n=1 Tax=Photobacterium galatheae TaxID=1654360 RepID=A0A066RS12_9GAMM|nr:DNA polymerase III subunit gamma/tau [Photobacterium galatheae]KDM93205.1 DNA polymerase III subunit gamma/tau [Photobacterium galatheae]MCM0148267.1 DNA polymerase III subunit gamma/tau [Photobacterium galatheae]